MSYFYIVSRIFENPVIFHVQLLAAEFLGNHESCLCEFNEKIPFVESLAPHMPSWDLEPKVMLYVHFINTK